MIFMIFQNTFVLKRRWDPLLSKRGHNQRRLRMRNFVYDFVEDGNVLRKPNINVILTDYVAGIGYSGDLVSVRPIRGYNNLLVTGLAVYDTPENRAKYDTEKRLKEIRRSPFIDRTINAFGSSLVLIGMHKENPWVIEPSHVRVSMRKIGLYVLNDSQIELPKTPITGPDPAKHGKDFYATITINNAEKGRVRCRIHHVHMDPKKNDPINIEFIEQPGELLFPDEEGQQPLELTNSLQPPPIH